MTRLSRTLTLWQLILGLAVTIIGGAISLGMAYAGVIAKVDAIDIKVDSIDTKVEARIKVIESKIPSEPRLSRMERNIVKIGAKMGVDVEDPE